MINNDLIIKLKKQASGALSIPVCDENDVSIGKLMLVTENDVHNEFYIGSLTNWRKRYMKYFLTQFEATINRTKAWLINTVIPSNNRLLFLIFDENGRLVGNIGIANIESNKCELDNLIRGERGGHPRLIYHSEIALLKWIFFEKSFDFVNLHVFSNNTPTLKLHATVGFKEISRKSLYRLIDHKGEISYISESGLRAAELAPFEYVEMGMSSKKFHSIHSLNKR